MIQQQVVSTLISEWLILLGFVGGHCKPCRLPLHASYLLYRGMKQQSAFMYSYDIVRTAFHSAILKLISASGWCECLHLLLRWLLKTEALAMEHLCFTELVAKTTVISTLTKHFNVFSAELFFCVMLNQNQNQKRVYCQLGSHIRGIWLDVMVHT